MIFRQLFDTKSSTYTYLIADKTTKKAIIIDPVFDKLPDYLILLNNLNLSLLYAIDTHTHADHISALGVLRNQTNCQTYMGISAEKNTELSCLSGILTDGHIISVSSTISLTAWHTPGHTDDSYSLVMTDRVFTGDTLLIRGTGRTDFQNGNPIDSYGSIQRLLNLPDDTLVFPGHDYKGWLVSTIGEERRYNPRLANKTQAEYCQIMQNLRLPHPALMDIAVPTNQNCGRLRPDLSPD